MLLLPVPGDGAAGRPVGTSSQSASNESSHDDAYNADRSVATGYPTHLAGRLPARLSLSYLWRSKRRLIAIMSMCGSLYNGCQVRLWPQILWRYLWQLFGRSCKMSGYGMGFYWIVEKAS